VTASKQPVVLPAQAAAFIRQALAAGGAGCQALQDAALAVPGDSRTLARTLSIGTAPRWAT
jgi:hypothetical protein